MELQQNTDFLCVGCMETLSQPLAICEHCHTDNALSENLVTQLSTGVILHGKYYIGKVLGSGGFAITYIGMDLNLRLKVAIKEYMPLQCGCRWQRQGSEVCPIDEAHRDEYEKGKVDFLEEARILARFAALNPHEQGVISVRDFFTENGTAYLVMDYVEGYTLKQYLTQKGGKLTLHETLPLLQPVAHSLQILHHMGILHLDISPDNIMLDTHGYTVLIDFGAAKLVNGEENRMPSSVKRGYTPPELYDEWGKRGTWSDVYSLSATIYKAITGVTPAQSLSRIMDSGHLRKPSDLGIRISAHQENVLMRGMELDIAQRYCDVQVLWTQLSLIHWRPFAKGSLSAIHHPAHGMWWFWRSAIAALLIGGGVLFFASQQHRQHAVSIEAQAGSRVPAAGVESTQRTSSDPSEMEPDDASRNVSPLSSADTVTRQQQFEENHIFYQVDSGLSATAVSLRKSLSTLRFPRSVGGNRKYPLQTIAASFSNNTKSPETVTRLIMPDNWKMNITDGAFRAFCSLQFIEGGNKIEDISKQAFEGTLWLKTQQENPPKDGLVTVFDGLLLEYIGDAKALTLPDTIRGVASGAFTDANGMTALSFSGEVFLQSGALSNLDNLSSLTFAKTPRLKGNPFGAVQAPLTVTFASNAKIDEQWASYLPEGSVIVCDKAAVFQINGVTWRLRE